MDSSIRSTLWGAFAVLVVLIAAGLALTIGILHLANRQEYRIVEGSAPLLDDVNAMNDDTLTIMSAARGFRSRSRRSSSSSTTKPCAISGSPRPAPTQLATDPRDAAARRRDAQALHRDQAAHATGRWMRPAKAATATPTSSCSKRRSIHRSAPDLRRHDGRRARRATNAASCSASPACAPA